MQERDVQWGDIVQSLLGGTANDRDVAEWQACAAVVRDIERYRPADYKYPPGWTEERHRGINALRKAQTIEDARDMAQGMPDAFALWRTSVTEYEATEAGKLSMLVWTIRTLYRLHESADESSQGVIDKLTVRIGDVLANEWRCGQELPLQGPYRDYPITKTRRLDLLPLSWRYV